MHDAAEDTMSGSPFVFLLEEALLIRLIFIKFINLKLKIEHPNQKNSPLLVL